MLSRYFSRINIGFPLISRNRLACSSRSDSNLGRTGALSDLSSTMLLKCSHLHLPSAPSHELGWCMHPCKAASHTIRVIVTCTCSTPCIRLVDPAKLAPFSIKPTLMPILYDINVRCCKFMHWLSASYMWHTSLLEQEVASTKHCALSATIIAARPASE